MTVRTARFKLTVSVTVFSVCVLAGCNPFDEQKSDAVKRANTPVLRPNQADNASQNFPSLTADQWINLSNQYHSEGRYLESIGAAQSALYLKPDSAEAYNNIGAAYASLHMWDSAILAAQQALHIKPDFQLAKNNLAWALEQKKLPPRAR